MCETSSLVVLSRIDVATYRTDGLEALIAIDARFTRRVVVDTASPDFFSVQFTPPSVDLRTTGDGLLHEPALAHHRKTSHVVAYRTWEFVGSRTISVTSMYLFLSITDLQVSPPLVESNPPSLVAITSCWAFVG